MLVETGADTNVRLLQAHVSYLLNHVSKHVSPGLVQGAPGRAPKGDCPAPLLTAQAGPPYSLDIHMLVGREGDSFREQKSHFGKFNIVSIEPHKKFSHKNSNKIWP
jgi:hypothetical protein